MDLTKLEIRETATVPAEDANLVVVLDGTASGTAAIEPAEDGVSVVVRLSEEQRARAILMSRTNGGIICTEGFNSGFHGDEDGCTVGGRGACAVTSRRHGGRPRGWGTLGARPSVSINTLIDNNNSTRGGAPAKPYGHCWGRARGLEHFPHWSYKRKVSIR